MNGRAGYRDITIASPPSVSRPYTPASSAWRSSSTLSAHSNRDVEAGWGLRLRPFGFTGSSAMNSAQVNIDCCGSEASSRWPLPSYRVGAGC